MLVAGGLLDQPAHLWFAVQFAGWLYELLRKQADKTTKPEQFTESENQFLMDVVMPIRMGEKPKL